MRAYMESDQLDHCWYRMIAALDEDCRMQRQKEEKLETVYGIPLPRCPVCGGRRTKSILGRVCAYCGCVNR